MAKYLKVEYWNGQKRYIKEEQSVAIETAISRNRPFKLVHAYGVDIVQPKAIALITSPTWQEAFGLPRDKVEALPEPSGDRERVPSEIIDVLKESVHARIVVKDYELANKLRSKYEHMLADWRNDNGKVI